MSIADIPDIKIVPSSHRTHPYALDFVVAVSAVAKYVSVYHGKIAESFEPTLVGQGYLYPNLTLAGKASSKSLALVPHNVLHAVLVEDRRDEPISYLEKTDFSQIQGDSTGSMATVIEGLAQAMFTRYYEENLGAIESAHGKRSAGRWPSCLQFGAIVRNAMSHGGTIHMNQNSAPATHYGLIYTANDNGRKVIHNDLSSSDIFFLMMDCDLAF